MRVFLAGQNNFGNRGCEALVRSTVATVRSRISSIQFLVPSFAPVNDGRQWPEAHANGVEFVDAGRVGARFIQWSRICSRIPALTALRWPRLPRADLLHQTLGTCDAVLSIGGDNYSLDYVLGALSYFVAIAELALERGIPVIQWGGSIGPFASISPHNRSFTSVLRRQCE